MRKIKSNLEYPVPILATCSSEHCDVSKIAI
jgi:hypothetical protein